MKEIFAPIIHERCALMARTETDALCQCPELGEDIYQAWTQTMDVSNPDDFDLTDYINELAEVTCQKNCIQKYGFWVPNKLLQVITS